MKGYAREKGVSALIDGKEEGKRGALVELMIVEDIGVRALSVEPFLREPKQRCPVRQGTLCEFCAGRGRVHGGVCAFHACLCFSRARKPAQPQP